MHDKTKEEIKQKAEFEDYGALVRTLTEIRQLPEVSPPYDWQADLGYN